MLNLQKDITQALKKYPSLKVEQVKDKLFVTGPFTAYGDNVEIETYDVIIGFSQDYPYAFPWVKETSGKIPKISARHVNIDGTLCFGNWQDEATACKSEITLIWFLDKILNTHLCREYVREKTGSYPTGERSHGIEGVWEGYYDIFRTNNKAEILIELNAILNHQKIGRNDPCYCGSEKKHKVCHEKLELEVLNIRKEKVIMFYKALERDYKLRK